MVPGSLRIRPAAPEDVDELWHALYYASHSGDEAGVGLGDIRSNSGLQRYVDGWGRDGDMGVIAEVEDRFAGAAWVGLAPETARDDPAFVDAATPELAIAVLPRFQGEGVGTMMLDRLIEVARESFSAVVLTVRAGNPAERLYLRLGFTEVGRIRNRVGTESHKMLLDLSPQRTK